MSPSDGTGPIFSFPAGTYSRTLSRSARAWTPQCSSSPRTTGCGGGEGLVLQPRDNVLIEYGLFAGAVGQRKAIICTANQPKTATDLQGIIVVDLDKPHFARRQIEAWTSKLDSLTSVGEVELVMERARYRRELEDVREQLLLEQQRSNDLQELLSRSGIDLLDFAQHPDWKLLFDTQYLRAVTDLVIRYFGTPAMWYRELVRCELSGLADRIEWRMNDVDRTRTYIAKVLRLFRRSPEPGQYEKFIAKTAAGLGEEIAALGKRRTVELIQLVASPETG